MAHDAITVAEEWVYATLSADAAVQAALGSAPNTRVWPAFAPQGATAPFATHDFAGGTVIPQPIGNLPPSAYGLAWQVTVWGDGADRQGLRPAVTAILAALLGSTMAGRKGVHFASADGTLWQVNTWYVAPVPAAGEMGAEGTYQRVTHEIRVELFAVA